jgi:adenylate cyclase
VTGSLLRSVKRPVLIAQFGGALVFLAIMGLRLLGGMEFLELPSYDLCIRWQPKIKETYPQIVLIEITEEDINALGEWPMADETLSRTLSLVLNMQPIAVGIDLFRDLPVPPGTEILNSVLSENGSIVAAWKFGESGIPPPPSLRNTEQLGFNDVIVDPGGIVRRGLLFLDDGKDVFHSFSLRLALLFLGSRGIVPTPDIRNPQHLRLGNTTVPPFESNDGGYRDADARGYQYLLDYRVDGSAFRSYTLEDLLTGHVQEGAIRDRIVLIGVNSQSVKDFFYTPFSRGIGEKRHVAGVRLQAHMLDQILRFALNAHSPVKSMTQAQQGWWILLWSLFGGTIGLMGRSPARFALAASGGTIIILAAGFLAFLRQLWIPVVPPVLAYLVSGVLVTVYMSSREKKDRAMLMQLFSKHVSREVAETIWQEREQIIRHGRPLSRNLTITSFFSDLRGFASLSEKLDPQDLMEWLNSYLETMTRVIMDHGGVVDDYAGDGIKANFGAPLLTTGAIGIAQDAVNAVKCALAMWKELNRLNDLWQGKGYPSLSIRIGIYTGPAVAGPLGSPERMKYTTVGDTVNTASRLESYDKEFAKDVTCRILIGESTLRHVGHLFKTERIGVVNLKGKETKISIYRVLGNEPATSHDESMEENK